MGAMSEQEVPVIWKERVAILTTPPCTERGHLGPPTIDVIVPKVEAAALNLGGFAKQALTSLDLPTRERFVSGVCPRCWDRLYGG